MTTEERGRVERLAPLVVGIALAIPTLLTHYPPMSDLPLHEGVIGILRHYGDPTYFPPGLYELNLGQANQLFHMLSWALSYLVGTRWAVKLVIAFSQIAIMMAGARLADHVGRTRWSAVLLAPLSLGYIYYWGLVANLLGFATLFFSLPLIDRHSAAPSARSTVKVVGAFILLFFAHESVLVIAIGFTAILAALRPLDRRLTPMRFAPVLFGGILVVVYHFLSRRTFGKIQFRVATTFPPFVDRVTSIPNVVFGSHELAARLMLFGLGLLAIFVLLAERIRSKEPGPPRAESPVRRTLDLLLHYRFELSGVVFLIGYFAAPSAWNGATLLYTRMAGPAWALLAITAAPRFSPARMAKLAIGVVPVAILLVSWPQFADANQTYENLDGLIAMIPKGSSVVLCNVDRPLYRTRVYSASPGPARAIAERGGRMSASLVTSPIAPIRIPPQYRWDEFDERTVSLGPKWLKPGHDLKRFEYVVAQSRDEGTRAIVVLAFKPDAELVAERGEWLLLRSKHPQFPLLSADSPPGPEFDTVIDRVGKITMMILHDQRMSQPPPPASAPPP